jgi:magnesium transporter
VIVDCAQYERGRRVPGELELERVSEVCGQDGAFVWLGTAEPTQEEFNAVAQEFGLHVLAVEDAVEAHQRPKLELYDDTVFVVLKTARYVDPTEVIEIGEIQLFVHRDFVVSVRHGEGSGLKAARRRLEHRPEFLRLGPGAVLYEVMDSVVDDYEVAADGIEVDIGELEQEVFTPGGPNPAERIYKLEREVIAFQRAVQPLLPAVDRMARGHLDVVPDELREYFRDVRDHLLRVAGRIESFRELLGNALQANLSQVTVRQNEDIRKISAVVAILAVPTMVAGIYGMNFEHMPELGWRLGYPLVLVLTLIICFALYRQFRRAGWL